jgi:hypothetical protein
MCVRAICHSLFTSVRTCNLEVLDMSKIIKMDENELDIAMAAAHVLHKTSIAVARSETVLYVEYDALVKPRKVACLD